MDASAAAQLFWFASIAAEMILVVTLILRRQYLAFPIFLTWLLFAVVSDVPLYWIAHHDIRYHAYQRAYVISSAIDYMLQLGVLLEIATAVLRPSKRSFSSRTISILLATATLGVVAIVYWAFRSVSHGTAFDAIGANLLKVNFLFAYLRLIVFALIAGFSQMLGITWRNHVIRLAGGLALYSAVSVVIQLTISHLNRSDPYAYLSTYYLLNRIEITSFIAALAFWIWSFVQKDAPRKEFTPQMQRFLVTISQTARRSRLGLTRSLGHK